jgi:TATA-binding protein-associated factor
MQECGIVADPCPAEAGKAVKEELAEDEEAAVAESAHRVLVFAQLKSLLDIVERDVLQPSRVSYLRLDGRWGCHACLFMQTP